MSAPNAGRQSPEPETQSGQQGGKVADPNSGSKSSTHAQEQSEQDLSQLPSNPKGPLDHAAEEKTAKGNGNPTLGGK